MILAIFMYLSVAVVSIPALVLGIECLMAVLPARELKGDKISQRPRVAVVVPAHNEELGVGETVASIRSQLQKGDVVIVVADNCTDSTAIQAVAAGGIAWERRDEERRGKGYALRFAFERLAADPPQVVICIDADCVLAADCIDRLSQAALVQHRPIQSAYLMAAAEGSGVLSSISSFAVLVKNFVRPRGLQRLSLPCLITGSGVAYPWQILRDVAHPEEHIVEDMQFSIDLSLAGYPPSPCMEAVVYSKLPIARGAIVSQRTRWEHGHLGVLVSGVPRLLWGFARAPATALMAMALELVVPPLSLFVPVYLLAGMVIAAASGVTGIWNPLALWAASGAVFMVGLALAWVRFGRSVLAPRQLLFIPLYAISKVPIYGRLFRKNQRTWIRTERAHSKAQFAPLTTGRSSFPTGRKK